MPSLPSIFALRPTSASFESGDEDVRPEAGGAAGAVVSVNYRLASYPDEEQRKGEGTGSGEEGGTWPIHLEDVKDAIRYLGSEEWGAVVENACGGEGGGSRMGGQRVGTGLGEKLRLGKGREWILVGHSVGATMAVMLALKGSSPSSTSLVAEEKNGNDQAFEDAMAGLRGIVALEGIYDFGLLRDRHWEIREAYEPWIRAVFGEDEGGWERGSVLGILRGGGALREGVEGVVVAHSKGDEAVEWEQSVELVEGLGERKEGGDGGRAGLVEVQGGHDEVVEKGGEVWRSVEVLLDWLGRRERDGEV